VNAAFEELKRAGDRLRPRVAIVLGSGLGGATAEFQIEAEVGYADVPGLVSPTVAGHKGKLAVGTWSGVPAAVFFGRVHFYEGHAWDRVTRTVELAAELGVKTLLLTNAAGGIRPEFVPGTLMVIRDHLTLLDRTSWKQFDDRPASPYSERLTQFLLELDPSLPVGTYAALTGPCYETPAEIRALAALGADAVGMSTAREAEAGVRLGMEVAAISTITNKAAGLSDGPLSHKEVEATARLAVGRLGTLVGRWLAEVG